MYREDGIFIMRGFPDFNAAGFDIDSYNDRFKQKNVIIHARSSDIAYPEHWGCLSIKCAFGGDEYYQANNTVYAVDQDRFLILNEGKSYSSYIYAEKPVESFTINFSAFFTGTVVSGLLADVGKLLAGEGSPSDTLDTPGTPGTRGTPVEFAERLYPHDDRVSPVLTHLYRLSLLAKPDEPAITEAYYILLERMLLLQAQVCNEIQRVKAVRQSTREELYKRLFYARDYIASCYMNPITLQELAGVACLNAAYFLRQFKHYFGVTPHQYLIRCRLKAAKRLLETKGQSITEICYSVGYEDTTSFIKLFKQHYGLTPEKYQLQHSKKSIFTG